MRAMQVTRIAVAVAVTATLVVGVDARTGSAPHSGIPTPTVQPGVSPTGPGTDNNPWD